MLFCESTIFLIVNAPTMIASEIWKRSDIPLLRQLAVLHFFSLLAYSCSAINFLFYCMSGSQFRNEFMELFRSCKMKINTFMLNSTQTSRSSNVDVQLEIGL
jgi:hypothetical protein